MHSLALGTLFIAWHRMIRKLTSMNDWQFDFKIYSLSLLARRIPLPIWYAGSRLVMYRERHMSMTVVLSATIIEAALLMLSGFVCYFLVIPWYTFIPKSPYWWILAAILMVFLVMITIRPSMILDTINWILRLFKKEPIQSIITRSDIMVYGIFYLSTWFLDGLGLYFFVSAIFLPPPSIPNLLGVSTISAMIALLTLIFPGGFGIKEITMGALLSTWMPLSLGIVISLLYRLMQTLVEILWALIGHWIGREKLDVSQPAS